jgi:hypothetical protein
MAVVLFMSFVCIYGFMVVMVVKMMVVTSPLRFRRLPRHTLVPRMEGTGLIFVRIGIWRQNLAVLVPFTSAVLSCSYHSFFAKQHLLFLGNDCGQPHFL